MPISSLNKKLWNFILNYELYSPFKILADIRAVERQLMFDFEWENFLHVKLVSTCYLFSLNFGKIDRS